MTLKLIAKRTFDLFFSLAGLLCLFPVFFVAAQFIRRDGGPIFFRQDRVGRHGKIFSIFKFRSMRTDAKKSGPQLTGRYDRRITPVGHFLRKTKIDELPQLINVFIGHMSLVGPRPEVCRYVVEWGEMDRKKILSAKPGITDYATLFYNDEQFVLAEAEDIEKAYMEEIMPHKLRMYRAYIMDQNLLLDLRLVVATLLKMAGFPVDRLVPEMVHLQPGRDGKHKKWNG